jgi:hypothetical protein
MQKRDERDMEEQKEHLKQKICRFTDTDVLFLEGKKKK